MENHDVNQTVMWREGAYRCELSETDGGSELRVYVSDVLTYREPVRTGTGGLRQAARLLAEVQATLYTRSVARRLDDGPSEHTP
jgi:hypothetical protein